MHCAYRDNGGRAGGGTHDGISGYGRHRDRGVRQF